MNKEGLIYAMTEEDVDLLNGREPLSSDLTDEQRERLAGLREDVARIDGYMRGRADSDGGCPTPDL